jgi:hypothetical protein
VPEVERATVLNKRQLYFKILRRCTSNCSIFVHIVQYNKDPDPDITESTHFPKQHSENKTIFLHQLRKYKFYFMNVPAKGTPESLLCSGDHVAVLVSQTAGDVTVPQAVSVGGAGLACSF